MVRVNMMDNKTTFDHEQLKQGACYLKCDKHAFDFLTTMILKNQVLMHIKQKPWVHTSTMKLVLTSKKPWAMSILSKILGTYIVWKFCIWTSNNNNFERLCLYVYQGKIRWSYKHGEGHKCCIKLIDIQRKAFTL